MTDDAELVAPVMAADYGARVLADGRRAPQLMVRFKCPRCGGEDTLDAFLGVPVCPGDNAILEGIAVIRETRPNKVSEGMSQVEPPGTVHAPYVEPPSDHNLWEEAVRARHQ